jgi:hypothetical protein
MKVGETLHRINDAPSQRLPVSFLLGDGDSLYQRYEELTTPRIIEGRFSENYSAGDSPKQQKKAELAILLICDEGSAIHHTIDNWESIFEFEYLWVSQRL